jgi:FkbM family methyltransferase
LSMDSSDLLLNYLLYDEDGKDLDFNISNNTQSSSVLNFSKHSKFYPQIIYTKKINKKSITLDTIIKKYSIDMSKFNMLNLDLQGVELRVLNGIKDNIKYIDYIYTEINTVDVYQGNDIMENIDIFLSDFIRVETSLIESQGWGDGLYVRKLDL